VSLNATSAAHVHSNIQTLTEEAEMLAADAHKTANKTDLVSNIWPSLHIFLFCTPWEVFLEQNS
jgi:hypothetical protein